LKWLEFAVDILILCSILINLFTPKKKGTEFLQTLPAIFNNYILTR
jgi:hypothetical protein